MNGKRVYFGAAGALSFLLILVLFAAACGGGDEEADPTATAPAGGDPTATKTTLGEPTDPPADPTDPPADPTDAPAEPTDVPADPTVVPTVPVISDTTVDVTLTEFVLDPSANAAPAGIVRFNVSSDGAIFHNLKVIETDLAPNALPTDDTIFSVDEEQVDVVATTADLNPGEQETLSVELAAGSYVLICNVPGGHYQGGMTAAFTVE